MKTNKSTTRLVSTNPNNFDDLFINNLLLILSYYDNIHDFGSLCTNDNKYICEELLKSYKKMLVDEIKIINESIDKYFEGNSELIKYYKKNFIEQLDTTFSTFDKNKHIFIDFVKYIIDKKINSIKKINFNDMQNIVLTNFKLIFNGITNIDDLLKILDYIGTDTIDINTYELIEFNDFLNKNKDVNNIELFYELKYVQKMIFLQRQQLYYLIYYYHHNSSGTEVKNMINYFVGKTDEKYKNIIIQNLNNTTIEQNITFPITMFDDMSTDTLNSDYIDGLFKFKMINSDKEHIDSALTFNGLEFKGQLGARQVMFIHDVKKEINPVFFSEKELIVKIKDYTFNFIQDNKYIQCKYDNDKIIFNIINNSVGRSYKKETELNEGIFQIIILIINILGKITKDNIKIIITEIELAKISKFIIIDDIFYDSLIQLKIYKNPNEIIITLLLGVKRFGDWSQMNISKKNYFYLQTDDLLCKLYGILIKAPVLWIDNNYNITVYNYDTIKTDKVNININFDPININIIHRRLYENTGHTFGTLIIHPDSKGKNSKKIADIKNKISELTNKITPFERIYYQKYIKYKTKYLELRKYL